MSDIIKNKNKLLEQLFALHRFGIKPGLERTIALAEKVGNPQNKFKSIHVAGTNGKGTVCSLIASTLIEARYKTGLYTSPHLVDFNERIQVNGKMISDEQIVEKVSELLEFGKEIEATFFEITTILAFMHFAENNVDVAVIETGMGGRFDSTNILNSDLAIITEIGIDHQEFLGENVNAIAFEKAGIIKQGKPVYIGTRNEKARDVIIEHAESLNSPFHLLNQKSVPRKLQFENDLSMQFRINNVTFNTKIVGEQHLTNAKIAYDAVKLFDSKIDDITTVIGFKRVIENTNLYGRMQIVSQNPFLLIDVAHNKDSIAKLVDTLSQSRLKNQNIIIVFSVMKDKDYPPMLQELNKISGIIYLVNLELERALETSILANEAINAGFKIVQVFNTPEKAYEKIFNSDLNYVMCGTFFLLGDFLKWHKEKFS